MNPAVFKIKRNNIRRIFSTILIHDGISRKEVGDQLGISAATVTLAINDLLAANLVYEVAGFSASLGRRTKLIRLNEKRNSILSINIIDEDTIQLRLCDLAGNIKADRFIPVPLTIQAGHTAGQVVDALLAAIDAFLNQHQTLNGKLLASKFTFRGMHLRGGLIEASLYNWSNFPITGAIQSHLGVPVVSDNVARTFGWYESLLIPDSYRSIVYLIMEPGTSIAYFKDKKPLLGKNNFFGELGHISINPHGPRCYCGNLGCIEGYLDNEVVLKRFQALLDQAACPILSRLVAENQDRLGYQTVFQAYRQGSILVQEILTEVSQYLGMTLLSIRNIFDPDCIVISGRLVSEDAYVLQEAIRFMRDRTRLTGLVDPEIKLAQMNDEKLETSSCAHALDKLLPTLLRA